MQRNGDFTSRTVAQTPQPSPFRPSNSARSLRTGQTGSFLSMAPEVMLARPYNEKADIFSLACCITEVSASVPASAHAARIMAPRSLALSRLPTYHVASVHPSLHDTCTPAAECRLAAAGILEVHRGHDRDRHRRAGRVREDRPQGAEPKICCGCDPAVLTCMVEPDKAK